MQVDNLTITDLLGQLLDNTIPDVDKLTLYKQFIQKTSQEDALTDSQKEVIKKLVAEEAKKSDKLCNSWALLIQLSFSDLPDAAKAATIARAARLGNAEALMLHAREIVKSHPRKAVRYYEKALELGNKQVLPELGFLYYHQLHDHNSVAILFMQALVLPDLRANDREMITSQLNYIKERAFSTNDVLLYFQASVALGVIPQSGDPKVNEALQKLTLSYKYLPEKLQRESFDRIVNDCFREHGQNKLIKLMGYVTPQMSTYEDALLTLTDTLCSAVFAESGCATRSVGLTAELRLIEKNGRRLLKLSYERLLAEYKLETDKTTPRAARIEPLITALGHTLQHKGPISELRIDTKLSAWHEDWPPEHKHLVMYVDRRKMLEKYAASLKNFITSIRLEIKSNWKNGLSSLWNKALPKDIAVIKKIVDAEPATLRDILNAGAQLASVLTQNISPKNSSVKRFYEETLEKLNKLPWPTPTPSLLRRPLHP